MSPTERSVAIDAFLESPEARALGGATSAQARTVLERFLDGVEGQLGCAPEEVDPHALHFVVGHVLPMSYAIGDPLAEVTGPVLEAYLEFLRPKLTAPRHMGLLEALRGTLPEFRDSVASGQIVHEHIHPAQHTDTFVREAPKVGRNDPCPCGSGKKFKQCHGRLS